MSEFYEITPSQFEENPFQLIGEDWMLITAEKDHKINTMTASWGGLGVMWNKNVAFIALRSHRYTKEFIDHSLTFSLTFFDRSYRKQLAYLGAVSGRDEDKMAKTNLTVGYLDHTPYFNEAKLVMFCKKLYAQDYKPEYFVDTTLDQLYPEKDYHTLYIGEITKMLIKK